MTPQGAIEIIKIAIAEVEWNYPMEYAKAFECTISALEKQIPKKPKILNYQPLIKAGWKHECPNCGCAVGKNKFTDYEYLEEYEEYCTQCGQALDWSEEDSSIL
jgi:endogenous inhibitor of DNA gyrase (YacG/DUF329 family)